MHKCALVSLLFLTIFVPQKAYAYLEDLHGLLSTYVTPIQEKDKIAYNAVDYDRWSTDKRHARVRKAIQTMDVSTLKTKQERMAFWVNAYNFFVIDLIIQKGERDSIQDLSGVKPVWERYPWSIGKDTYTLQDIIDKELRPLNDPRVYFLLSCGAKSCPDLLNKAYTADKINEQLLLQTKKFLQNRLKGFALEDNGKTVKISRLFEWHEKDFNKGNIKPWLYQYFPLFINADTQIKYLDFDWSLNN